MTSKIVFQYSAGNSLSFVLRQNGSILICQKKHLQKHKIISSSFQFCIWLKEEELCLSLGNISEGKSLLGQCLCVPYQGYANRHDLASFHLENEKLYVALKYFILEKGAYPTESFVYNLAE